MAFRANGRPPAAGSAVRRGAERMDNKTILLAEDNPDDEVLTLRALRSNSILGEVVVARDTALVVVPGSAARRGGN